jgi:hypothetical protein
MPAVDGVVKSAPGAPFPIKELHKNALLTLLHCHHNNRQTLTYSELSLRIGVGEKTKSWQSGAWKDLKSHGYVVPSSSSDKKSFELSEKGVELASAFASDEELAEFKVPETNEELHEIIKAKLLRLEKAKMYGPKILDMMIAPNYTPINRHEMAKKLNVLADSHGFFYGLQALQKMGYVVFCTDEEIAEMDVLRCSEACEAKPQQETSLVLDEEAEENDASGGGKRSGSSLDESDETNQPKKKKYKSKKKRSGGKPLKLSSTAFVHPPGAAVAATVAVTPNSGKS